MDASSADWMSQLQPEARQRIVNKINETLKRCLPISTPEALNELKSVAIRFEDKVYSAATSQSDYLRKISLKMLSLEMKRWYTTPIYPAISNAGAVNQNPIDPDMRSLAGDDYSEAVESVIDPSPVTSGASIPALGETLIISPSTQMPPPLSQPQPALGRGQGKKRQGKDAKRGKYIAMEERETDLDIKAPKKSKGLKSESQLAHLERERESAYDFSTKRCLEVYSELQGFTLDDHMKAHRFFKEQYNREFFLSMQEQQRGSWLRLMFDRMDA